MSKLLTFTKRDWHRKKKEPKKMKKRMKITNFIEASRGKNTIEAPNITDEDKHRKKKEPETEKPLCRKSPSISLASLRTVEAPLLISFANELLSLIE